MSNLQHLLTPLNETLFVMGQDHVSSAELLGFATGVWCVWLTVRAKVANFPVGLANDLFFFLLFFAARLYADACLQIIYFALGLAGWFTWIRGSDRAPLPITKTRQNEMVALLTAVFVGTVFLTWFLTGVHDGAPFLDALTTSLSLAAQWLLNFKKLQNWYFWIFADLIYIPLYTSKHLWLTSLVYLVFLVLCLSGLRSWKSGAIASRHELIPVETLLP